MGPGGTGYSTRVPTAVSRAKRKLNGDFASTDLLNSNWDKTLVAGLKTLTALLPEPYAENPQLYDMLPHPSIGHLISLSL